MTKTIKKSLALILSILMLMSVVPFGASYAAVVTEGNYEYDRVYTGGRNEITILKYSGNETDVVIPETFSSYPVVAIGNEDKQPFSRNKTIETVVIPDTVKSIAGAAFYDCSNLTTITIGANLTSIGSKAFYNCSLNTVNYKGTKAQWESLIANTESHNNAIINPNLTINYNYGYDCAADGHKEATFVESKTATCDEEGNISYWCCGVCEAKFSDETLTTPASDVVLLANHKTLTETVEVPATCTVAGNYAYWFCSVCETYFKDATATEAFENADATVIDALTHDWTENFVDGEDGKHYQICQREGCAAKNEETAAIHNWNDGEITADSTCNGTGTKIYTCTACGVTKTETIDVKVHNLSPRAEKPATCLEDGYSKYWYCETCGNCFADEEGKVLLPNGREALSKTGHNFKEYAEVKATCTEKGNDAYKECLNCGKFFDADAASDSTEGKDSAAEFATNVLYHNWKSTPEIDKKATCEEDGSMSTHCTRCTDTKDVIVIAKREHTLVDESVAVEAGCITTGEMNVKCSNVETETHEACTYTTTSEIDASGHSFYNKVDASASTCKVPGNLGYKQCRNCNLYFADNAPAYAKNGVSDTSSFALELLPHTPAEAVEENRVEAKCEVAGSYDSVVYCSACDDELSRETKAITALEHNWGKGKTTTAPTCTEKGVKTYTCSICKGTKTEDIAEKGHTEVENHIQEPTCTEPGKTGGVYCSVCAKYVVDAEEIPALGHDWEKLEGHKDATCTEEGKNNLRCKRDGCDATDTSVTEALGHDYSDWTVDYEPTCSATGSKTRVCNRYECKNYENIPIPAAGHVFETIDAVEPKCNQSGYVEHKYCDVCDKYFAKGAADTSVDGFKNDESFVVNDPTNHKNTENDEIGTSPTCLGIGYTGGTYCQDCRTWVSGHTEIPAAGHVFETIAAVEPKCNQSGYVEHKYCDVCDKYFAKDAAKTSVDGFKNDESFVVYDPTNHKAAESHDEVPATCLEAGIEAGSYCKDCETWISGHGVIPALGHTFADDKKVPAAEATCLGTGNDAYKQCSTCNLYFADNAATNATNGLADTTTFIIAQLNHSYIGVVRSNGNGEENTHSFKCVNGCDAYGATEPHDWNNGAITTPARCLTDGVMTYTCEEEDCGATYTTVIPATKHSFSAEVDYKATSCLEAGNEAYKYCAGCELYFAEDAEITSTEGVEDEDEFEIEILTHSYIGAVRSDGNGENNTHSFKCVNGCNQYGGADNHAWNNGAVTTAPNCLDRGVKTYTCTVENCGATYTESIQANGHDFDTAVEAVAATCVAKGNNAYKKCKVCNKYFAGDAAANATGGKNNTTTFVTDINTNNHAWSEEVFTTSDGTTKTHTRKCTRATCTQTLPVGHNFNNDDFVQEIAATCINTGTEKAYCSYCRGDVYRIIPATGICVDKDKNNKCDVCEKVIEEKPADPTPETPDTGDKEEPINCDCNCHKSGIMGLLYDFILFFQRLFGFNKTCVCGRAHY